MLHTAPHAFGVAQGQFLPPGRGTTPAGNTIHRFPYRSTDGRRCARRLVTASVSPNTHETDARVLPQAWHSSRSLEDSALAAYHAALYDAGRPFSKPSVTRPCATSV